MRPTIISCFWISVLMTVVPAHAGKGRLLATGGVTNIEGSGGGGITPWASLSSYAEADEWGATLTYSAAGVDDFGLRVQGVSVTYGNRVEVSYARQQFDLDTIGGELEQDIWGAKVRLTGDLIYGDIPQISLGVQHKKNRTFALPQAVGARSDKGTDYYLSAGKAWLHGPFARTWLANITLRATKANQTGLLGFGGDKGNSHELMAEAAVAMFVNRYWVIGTEYRQKPDNLGFAGEHDWHDVFVAWFPNKTMGVVGAYTNLKSIAGLPDQKGWYLSLQVTF
ncbi:DUF3034 family protein [Pseudidiomarina sp.]|uniref:DUF3034 family protein n=1 Tax=Pseudidiomarina sp. TaxID=2081707 RepID=UPI00299DB2BE|nr:DUF3034 family protein [Pseudidiomarina sp.]MDX1705096.1 DUF3034 family protein [Pseudidiomarina sp.]